MIRCEHALTVRTAKQRRLWAALLRAEDRDDTERVDALGRVYDAITLRRRYRYVPSCPACVELLRLRREKEAYARRAEGAAACWSRPRHRDPAPRGAAMSRPRVPSMTNAVTIATTIGRRDRQEDRAAAFVVDGHVVAVLADGMGGHADGDLAAQAAVEAVVAHVTQNLPGAHDCIQVLRDAAWAAAAAVERTRDTFSRSGCTLDIVAVRNGSLMLAHVGDAAIWREEPNGWRMLTEPHEYPNGWLTSCIPAIGRLDSTMFGTSGEGLVVLATDGIPGQPFGVTAEEMVRAQLAWNLNRQDNATAIVINLAEIAANNLSIGPIVEVAP